MGLGNKDVEKRTLVAFREEIPINSKAFSASST
jgi:hypothetical protein